MKVPAILRKKEGRELVFIKESEAELVLPVKSVFREGQEAVLHERLLVRVKDRILDLPLDDVLKFLRSRLGPRMNAEGDENEQEQTTLH